MQPTLRPRIKICCIQNVNEARLAIKYGAAALGFVSEMPSGPGVISEELIYEIAAKTPPAVATFLLTSRQHPSEIILQQKRCGTNSIQLVDNLREGSYSELRTALPGITLIPVIHVTGPESIVAALALAPQVNGVLLDSGNPNLAVKELGGTGRTHDWEISKEIRQRIQIPVFLAGGLHAGNVTEAIRRVRPFGVDVCSGVRTDGQLDEIKLAAFMSAAGARV
jgi:phosphoribosylanthranilate isomerase